jgi:hypothetical protein
MMPETSKKLKQGDLSRCKMTDIVASNRNQIPSKTVQKSHLLLMSPQNLTSRQHDMLLLFCSKIKGDEYELPILDPKLPQSEQDKTVQVPTFTFEGDVLEGWFDIPRKQMASKLAPTAEQLAKSLFGYKEFNGNKSDEFKYRTLFSEISYRRAKLTFIPNQLMWRMLIDYSKGYALINHVTFRKIKSEYAKHLYQLLSRWKEDHNRMKPMTIAELQDAFGVFDYKGRPIKSSLARPHMFITRVVEASILELAEIPEIRKELIFHTDEEKGTLGYKATKKGRAYTHIKFLYHWITPKALPSMTEVSAKKIINDLAIVKRTTKGIELTIDDCTQLYTAYKFMGMDERADAVHSAIKTKKAEEDKKENEIIENPSQSSVAIEKMLGDLEAQFNVGFDEY